MKGQLEKGINQVCFNRSAEWVAAVSIDEYHTLLVYDIGKGGGAIVAQGRGPRSDILDMLFA